MILLRLLMGAVRLLHWFPERKPAGKLIRLGQPVLMLKTTLWPVSSLSARRFPQVTPMHPLMLVAVVHLFRSRTSLSA